MAAGADSNGGSNNSIPPNQDTSAAWAKCAKNLWDHDEATVKGWKEEIDTLLVFVRSILFVVCAVTDSRNTGGSILRSADCIQRPMLPDAATGSAGHSHSDSRADISSIEQFPRQQWVRKFDTAVTSRIADGLLRPTFLSVDQRALVFQSCMQSRLRICFYLDQAVAKLLHEPSFHHVAAKCTDPTAPT